MLVFISILGLIVCFEIGILPSKKQTSQSTKSSLKIGKKSRIILAKLHISTFIPIPNLQTKRAMIPNTLWLFRRLLKVWKCWNGFITLVNGAIKPCFWYIIVKMLKDWNESFNSVLSNIFNVCSCVINLDASMYFYLANLYSSHLLINLCATSLPCCFMYTMTHS